MSLGADFNLMKQVPLQIRDRIDLKATLRRRDKVPFGARHSAGEFVPINKDESLRRAVLLDTNIEVPCDNSSIIIRAEDKPGSSPTTEQPLDLSAKSTSSTSGTPPPEKVTDTRNFNRTLKLVELKKI
ncbi:hypothetical protein KGM_204077 [Danaus plexippus plexippus]|uniref:Uncharacterized protein n=1 Tax=Danaus plexippus plexippus TaxID=278856 RepID=A0A212F345_DANPL|nr:hypothetical protein KGM_204077 [Danaus plexippus plexippus]